MTKKIIKHNFNKKTKLIIWGSIIFIFLALFVYTISGLPSIDELENPKPVLASRVFSADGELIGQFYIENRIETDIDSLPPYSAGNAPLINFTSLIAFELKVLAMFPICDGL